MLVPNTIPVLEDKSLDPVPGHGGGPRCWQGEPTSSANYESSSGQILSSLQTVSQSAG